MFEKQPCLLITFETTFTVCNNLGWNLIPNVLAESLLPAARSGEPQRSGRSVCCSHFTPIPPCTETLQLPLFGYLEVFGIICFIV